VPAPLTSPPPGPINPLALLIGLQYVPPAVCFNPATADIYTGTGSLPVPGFPGGYRLTGVPVLVTGSWMAGHRQAVRASDAYTHIMLVDPAIEIRDPYTGNGQTLGTAPDAVVLTGETLSPTVDPWRFVVFSFITLIPGLGKRKVVFLDQRGTYPATTFLKDTFTDAANTVLTSHVMDAGPAWLATTGTLTIDASGRAQIQPASAADAGARANSGVSSFTTGALDVYVQPAAASAGMAVRSTDNNNEIEVLLTTTTLEIDVVQAGVRTNLASQAVAFVAGSKHTLAVSASGNQITASVDGGTPITGTTSFNQTRSGHGVILHYDAGSAVYAGPVDNFLVS